MTHQTKQALLNLQGIVRTLREEATDARTKEWPIEPVALEHYANLLDKARDTLAFEHEQRLTNDDTAWLKTVLKSLARCVATAEATGGMISVGEIRGVIEVVNDAKTQGGAE